MAEHPYPVDDGGGQGRSDVAQQQGQEVAGHAREEGGHVADTARDQAGRVADEARRQTNDVMAEARETVREQARAQTDRAGSALDDLGSRVQALADGRPEEAGQLPDYAERLASQVNELAGRVDELGLDGLLEETQRFARRRPGAFLLGAAAAGFAVSRLGRGAKDADTRPAATGSTVPTSRTDRAASAVPPERAGVPSGSHRPDREPVDRSREVRP